MAGTEPTSAVGRARALRRFPVAIAIAIALILPAATGVRAQDDPPAATADDACERARAAFERGTDAVDQGRLAEGRELLRSAAELCPIVQVWFNLGYALRRSGFTTESIEVFDALLADRYGALTAEQRESIEGERSGAERELATVRLVLSPPVAATIALDGRRIGTAEEDAPFTLRADPGQHVVAASLDEARGETRFEVMRGQELDVSLQLIEPGGVPSWVFVGAGAILGVGLVITIILLAIPESLPQRGRIVET